MHKYTPCINSLMNYAYRDINAPSKIVSSMIDTPLIILKCSNVTHLKIDLSVYKEMMSKAATDRDE